MKIIELRDNILYYYIISYYSDDKDFYCQKSNNNIDISIFEIDEWNNLLEISKIFKDNVNYLNDLRDDTYQNISRSIKNATYYLYDNCPYCMYKSFNDLEYYEDYKNNIYERIFNEIKNEDRGNITIDYFRKWIISNYKNIINNKLVIESFINYE